MFAVVKWGSNEEVGEFLIYVVFVFQEPPLTQAETTDAVYHLQRGTSCHRNFVGD